MDPNAPEDPKTALIELCRGKAQNDRAYHAFLKMTHSQHSDYERALASGKPVNVLKYGVVLHAGWGETPEEAVCARILQTHSADVKIAAAFARHQAGIKTPAPA